MESDDGVWIAFRGGITEAPGAKAEAEARKRAATENFMVVLTR
jgi:hypothetical protein